MRKFALAFYNLFDNEMELHFLNGLDEVDVAIRFLNEKTYDTGGAPRNFEDLKQWCFDCDCGLNVKELPHA